MRLTALATRSGGWWVVDVPEVDGAFTQAKRLDQVSAMVRDAVALLDDVPATSIEVELVPDVGDEIASMLHVVREQRAESERLARLASDQVAAVAQSLSDEQGYSLRDIGIVLGVSHQRVAQILDAKFADREARASKFGVSTLPAVGSVRR